MKKHVTKIMCSMLAAALVLSACGQGNPAETVPSAGNADASATSPSEGGKISILTAMAYATEDLDKVLDTFKSQNPGLEIEIQHVPNGFEVALAARVNTGDIPDIFVSQTGSAVSSYYEYAYDFTDDPIVDKIQESAIEISKNDEGKLLSLPWTFESMGFIYDQKIFDELGITEMPKTINELEEICKKIKEAGYDAFAVGLKEAWILSHIGSHFIADTNADPKETVKQLNDGTLTFATLKNFKNVFDVLDLMIDYGPNKPLEVDWEISENKLANSEAAIIHMGDWCEATLFEFNPDAKFAFMPVPVGNDSSEPTFLSSISWQFVVHKDSKNLEKSRELLEFMLTSDEGIEWMTKGVKAVPSAKTDAKPDGLLASSAEESIHDEKSLPWNHVLWPDGFNPIFGSALQSYILGEMDREQVMEHLNNEWQMAKK